MNARTTGEEEEVDVEMVLLRYRDSCKGFLLAAEMMGEPGQAADFREVAERRREIGERIAAIMPAADELPDDGSLDGMAHRWWMQLREAVEADELRAVFLECARGESVLAEELEKVMASGQLDPDQRELFQEALDEVRMGIDHFRMAAEPAD